MANEIKISWGDSGSEIPLYYDPDDGLMMLDGGSEFGVPEDTSIWHENEYRDGDMMVHKGYGNREWTFKLATSTSDYDTSITLLNKLSRMASTARAHHLEGNTREVYLQIQLDGMTNYTRYTVKDVLYDKMAIFNFFNMRGGDFQFSDAITCLIITDPIGYGAEETLCNEIRNPEFGFYTTGLAKYWNESFAPTSVEESSIALIGGSAQKVTADAGAGIQCDTVTASSSQNFIAYVWVKPVTAGADVRMTALNQASTGITFSSSENTVGDATETITRDGETWYKLWGIGQTGAADTGIKMRIVSAGGTYEWIADEAYIQLDTQTVPKGFIGYKGVSNYYNDDGSVLPYFSVDHLSGDVDVLPIIDFTGADSSMEGLYTHIIASSAPGCTEREFYCDWGTTTYITAGVVDSDYQVIPSVTTTSVITMGDSDIYTGDFAMVVRASDQGDGYLKLSEKMFYGSDNIIETILNEDTTDTNIILRTFGPINMPDFGSEKGVSVALTASRMYDGTASTTDARFYWYMAIPCDAGYAVGYTRADESVDYAPTINSEKQTVFGREYSTSSGFGYSDHMGYFAGKLPRLKPKEPGRVYAFLVEADEHDQAKGNMYVTMKYKPRTETLLGV